MRHKKRLWWAKPLLPLVMVLSAVMGHGSALAAPPPAGGENIIPVVTQIDQWSSSQEDDGEGTGHPWPHSMEKNPE